MLRERAARSQNVWQQEDNYKLITGRAPNQPYHRQNQTQSSQTYSPRAQSYWQWTQQAFGATTAAPRFPRTRKVVHILVVMPKEGWTMVDVEVVAEESLGWYRIGEEGGDR